MRPKVCAFSVVLLILCAGLSVTAQSGKSSTQQGSTPNGRPFVALQGQIDSLETRMAIVEVSIADLDAQWQEAEARLEEQGGTLQALIEADRALQELMSALQEQGDTFQAQLEVLALELSEKQAAILQSCAPGSSIRQVSSDGTVSCELDDASAGGAAPIVLSDFDTGNLLVGPGATLSKRMVCPSPYRAISGGYVKGTAGHVIVDVPDGNGWRVGLVNPTATASNTFLRVFVRCFAP